MKARVKATGEIVEVEQANTYRFNDGSFVEVFRDLNTDALYFGRDLDFDIEGKFAETCLNGIKQGVVYDPDYWTRLEHQYAGMAMQGICSSHIIMEKINRINAEGDKFGVLIAELSANLAHALVEKMKEERK